MKLHTGICLYCKREYTKNRPIRGTTCSAKCSANFHRAKPKEIRNCKTCNKEFTIRITKSNKYCSHSCASKTTKNNTKLTEQDRDLIVEQYLKGRSSLSICKDFSVSGATILDVLKSKEIIRRTTKDYKIYINESRNNYYKHMGLCLGCSNQMDRNGTYCTSCLAKYHGKDSQIRLEAKVRVFDKYGNRCNCCGLEDSKYFTIDHINGGGRKHTSTLNADLYIWLDQQDRLPEFQILCWNCNCAKGYWGMCPHQPNFKWREVKKINCRNWRIKIKLKVLEYYGKLCSCCKESTFEFLSIDHINKNGYQHRKDEVFGKYASIYHYLRDHNYPTGYQVLCYNCNAVSFKQECIHNNEVQNNAT